MTTGRINQVAFLTDAGIARGTSSPGGSTARDDTRPSYATSDERLFRAKGVEDPEPSGYAAPERSSDAPRPTIAAPNEVRGVERGTRFAVRPASSTTVADAGQKRDDGTQDCLRRR